MSREPDFVMNPTNQPIVARFCGSGPHGGRLILGRTAPSNHAAGALLCCVLLVLCLAECQAGAADEASSGATNSPARWRQRGQFVHDPSTIARCGSQYWVFSTGPGISSWHSTDLKKWEAGPRVFSAPPAWTTNVMPGFRGYFWAPDILTLKSRFLLYYSVSSWGKNKSAIGLATNPTLDPADPSFCWTDQGLVFESHPGDSFNAIDPSVMQAEDGSMWLAVGSFWSGIKLVQLDPETGKRTSPGSPIHSLAGHETIEAPCLCQHGEYYYLFVNWGLCCRGTNSTYNIRVGRSVSVTGPFVDRDGRDMLHGGGSLFLGSEGRFIGPGHAGIFTEGQTNWFSFHFYDAVRGGVATLAVRRLQWSTDGWPRLQQALEP